MGKMGAENRNLITKQGRLDIIAAREIFKNANTFITNLWKILPLPNTETEEADADPSDDTWLTNTKPVKLKMFGKASRAQSLEELHDKLEELKGTRKGYKEKLLKKGLKSRITKRQKNEERRLQIKERNLLKKQRAGPEFQSKAENIPSKPARPIYNSEGKMVFSKFDFTEAGATSGMPQKTLSSDPKALLKKLEIQNEKIKKFEMQGDTEKVKAVKESFAWKACLDMAEGKKLKDNRALLLKSIKKRTDRKQQSKKKWDERNEALEKKIDLKQKKRTGNIEARKDKVKKNKNKQAAKRGRVVIGF